MSLKYSFDRSKLPKGMSFPLKRSELDNALTDFNIPEEQIWFVRFLLGNRKKTSIVMRLGYESEAFGGHSAGLCSIDVHAVPSSIRSKVHDALIHELPEVCKWLQKAIAAGDGWRLTDHVLAFYLEGDDPLLVYEDGRLVK